MPVPAASPPLYFIEVLIRTRPLTCDADAAVVDWVPWPPEPKAPPPNCCPPKGWLGTGTSLPPPYDQAPPEPGITWMSGPSCVVACWLPPLAVVVSESPERCPTAYPAPAPAPPTPATRAAAATPMTNRPGRLRTATGCVGAGSAVPSATGYV